MPSIADPMSAFVTFQPALDRGEIDLQQGDLDRNVYVHMDQPNGETRYTYMRLDGRKVTSMCQIIMAPANEGLPCFQLGYAVPERMRGAGRAKDITMAALAELKNGLARHGLREFFVEAVVGASNEASQHVARAILGGEGKPISDEASGEDALQFMKKIVS